MQGTDVLRRSLDRLGERREQFARDVVSDLDQRHPAVLGAHGPVDPAAVLSVLVSFARNADLSANGDRGEEGDSDVLDLADSLMKTFAQSLGRAQWTAGLALTWNSALRRSGEALLAELRTALGS